MPQCVTTRALGDPARHAPSLGLAVVGTPAQREIVASRSQEREKEAAESERFAVDAARGAHRGLVRCCDVNVLVAGCCAAVSQCTCGHWWSRNPNEKIERPRQTAKKPRRPLGRSGRYAEELGRLPQGAAPVLPIT